MTGWGPKVSGGGGGGGGGTTVTDLSVSFYQEALAVPNGVTVDIITHVVGLGYPYYLAIVEAACTNIANYKLLHNGVVIAQYDTWFNGPGLLAKWEFSSPGAAGIRMLAGDQLIVRATHYRPDDGDFWARIQLLEEH